MFTFSKMETLNKFLSVMVESFNEIKPDYLPILCTSDDVCGVTVKMNKYPVKRHHFTQFNNQDYFNELAKIFDLLSLKPSHKVFMLLPSANYCSDSTSPKLMTSFNSTSL